MLTTSEKFSCFTLMILLALIAILGQPQVASAESWIDRKHAPTSKSSAPWLGETLSGATCSGKGQGFGPYDYRKRHSLRDQIRLVEGAHYTPPVEALVRGKTAIDPYGDTDYTLRAWPNHHRALNSISRYYFNKNWLGKNMPTPPECYFQRAINFTSDDATTRMLFAMYLQKRGRLQQAEEQYAEALELNPDNTQLHYNYGLLLVKQKRYADAKTHAKIAYERSYPFLGLKNLLKNAGYWP